MKQSLPKGWRWVVRGPAPVNNRPHAHKLPGWFSRRRWKIREGDVIRCRNRRCGKKYVWTRREGHGGPQPVTFSRCCWVEEISE